ncbi:MAG: hypothetical protein Q9178_003599 [Gyalolechia marmorata]
MEVKVDAEASQLAVSGDVGCYEMEHVQEGHPEPPRRSPWQLLLGIIVHQYSTRYRRASIKELEDSLLGWELEFPASAIKDFVCEQRKVDSWAATAPPGAQRTIDSIRFRLVEQPKSSDCSILVKPVEDDSEEAGEEAVGGAGGKAGEEAGKEAGEDTGAAMELDPKAAELPLATLDLRAGMEIRLAFEGGSTTRVTKGPYFWIWPMVIHILAGRHYNATETNQNRAELNEWAESNQTGLSLGSLERIHSYEGTAWHLHPRSVSEAQAQPADLETPLALSRPTITPRPRIPKPGAAESFNFERPEKREYDDPEAKEAETQRILKGFRVAYQRKKRTAEELSQLQRRLAAETKNMDAWLDAFMEALEHVEADELARKKRA